MGSCSIFKKVPQVQWFSESLGEDEILDLLFKEIDRSNIDVLFPTTDLVIRLVSKHSERLAKKVGPFGGRVC